MAGGDDDEEDEEDEEENDDEDSDDEQQQQHEGGGGGAQLSGHLLLLCVRRGARVAGMAEGWAGDEVHRVPLVPELVVRCDRAARTLAVRPPPGEGVGWGGPGRAMRCPWRIGPHARRRCAALASPGEGASGAWAGDEVPLVPELVVRCVQAARLQCAALASR